MSNNIVMEKETLFKAITDPEFARGIFSEMPLEAFKGKEEHELIYQTIRNHYRYNATQAPPTERVLKTAVEEVLQRRDKISSQPAYNDAIEGIYAIIDSGDENETQIINSKVSEFIRSQMMYQVLKKFASSGKDIGDADQLRELIPKIQDIALTDLSNTDDSLYSLYTDTESKMNKVRTMADSRYQLGLTQIDKITGGGLARGEVGMILARSGAGKSTIAVQIHNNYSKRGLNTLYVALEEKEGRMIWKLEQNLLGIDKSLVFEKDGTLKEEAYKKVQSIYENKMNLGQAFLSKHHPQEITVSDIDRILSKIQFKYGVNIDVVIIDYPDLMYNPHVSRGATESDGGGKLMEDIRALAGRKNFICWTLSQLNRGGYGSELNTAEYIEGSKRKLNAVEVALTLNQTPEEFKHNQLRLYIDKLRYREAGMSDDTLYFKINPVGLIIKDETPEEIAVHRDRLGLPNLQARQEKQKETINDVQGTIGDINDKLGG